MILYFSGTGNSRYVARKIAEISGDDVISINERLKKGSYAPIKSSCGKRKTSLLLLSGEKIVRTVWPASPDVPRRPSNTAKKHRAGRDIILAENELTVSLK